MDDFYVYRHIRLDTNTVFYVGKGHKNRAFSKHNRNRYWKFIINQTKYLVEFIETNLSEQDAFFREENWIYYYKSLSQCEANFTDGGEGTSGTIAWNKGKRGIYSEEVLRKMSVNRIGKYKGENSHNYHVPCPEETKQQISETLKRKYKTGEILPIGTKRTKEQKEAQSKLIKGRYLRSKSPTAKKIINTITGQTWGCIKDCAEEYQVDRGTITIWIKNGKNGLKYYIENNSELRYNKEKDQK